MTSTSRLRAVADSSDDIQAELANLRAAYESACAELIEVRRQRDEAIAHGQELLARLVQADDRLADVSVSEPVAPPAEPIKVAPPQPAPATVSPVPTIVGGPAPMTPVVAPSEPDAARADDATEEDVAGAEVVDAEVAEAQPRVVRWLPPEEEPVAPSSAHEFAALKELPVAGEDDEVPATTEPLTHPMNVLPDVVEEPKAPIWKRRLR
jgi:hypothetical protein